MLALRPFGDLVDEAAQGLGVAGGGRSAVAGQEPLEGAGGQALDIGGADPYPFPLGDEGGVGGGAGHADPGGWVGAGYALAGEVGQQVDSAPAAPALGVSGRLQVPADGGVAQLPHQAAQGEVSGIGAQEGGTVGVGQGDPGTVGYLGQEGRGGVLGVGGGGQQEAPGGAGQGHDEHAALVGAHLCPGGRHGAAAAGPVPRGGGACCQASGDGVDEEAGAGQGVSQAQVGPAVPFQPGDHDELPLLARATCRGHDGDALRSPALGGDGVRGQDLGVELGQEAGGVLARVTLGPDLGAFEQGRHDVEVVLGGLGQE